MNTETDSQEQLNETLADMQQATDAAVKEPCNCGHWTNGQWFCSTLGRYFTPHP